MKRIPLWLAALACCLQVPVSWLLYEWGVWLWGPLLLMQLGAAALNERAATCTGALVVLTALHTAAAAAAHLLTAYRYEAAIGMDAVGRTLMGMGLAAGVIITAALGIDALRRRKQPPAGCKDE